MVSARHFGRVRGDKVDAIADHIRALDSEKDTWVVLTFTASASNRSNEAQAYLDRSEAHWADTRIDGTTKRQVAVMFEKTLVDRPR